MSVTSAWRWLTEDAHQQCSATVEIVERRATHVRKCHLPAFHFNQRHQTIFAATTYRWGNPENPTDPEVRNHHGF